MDGAGLRGARVTSQLSGVDSGRERAAMEDLMVANDGVVTHQFEIPRLGFLSLLVLALAALVASLVIVLRSDETPPAALVVAEQESGLTLQVVVPGLGAGAPRDLGEFAQLEGGSLESRVELTARRYGMHLISDIVQAPRVATAPLQSAEEVQIALTIAAKPALYRDLAGSSEVTISATVLARQLDLAPNEPLPPAFSYTILRGDTVSRLATRFGLEIDSILFNNFELRDPDRLPVGGELTIPTADGVVYTVRLGDTLFAIADLYAADVSAILAFEGNGLASADQLVEGTTILLAGGSASVVGPLGGGFSSFAPLVYAWPLGGQLTDFFGAPRSNRLGFHAGIDLSAPTGTFIGSTAAGIVIQAGWDGSYGLAVLVDHGGGVVSRYAHLSHIDVFLGEFVEAHDLIGFVGSTGLASGPHLHFEIIQGGAPVNPLVLLNS